jgi:F420-0:gamma-glutamyl ligase
VISIIPVAGLPEIQAGDELGALIAERAELVERDVVVVAQKVVSKAEGRVIRLDDVEASARARELAGTWCDPRELEVILREAARVRLRVRRRRPLERGRAGHARPPPRGPGRERARDQSLDPRGG